MNSSLIYAAIDKHNDASWMLPNIFTQHCWIQKRAIIMGGVVVDKNLRWSK